MYAFFFCSVVFKVVIVNHCFFTHFEFGGSNIYKVLEGKFHTNFKVSF